MIFWTTVNIATACLVSGIVVYMFSAYHERFRVYERLVMGGIASGMILRIGPIIGKNILAADSPYDDWATSFLHISLAGAALCVLYRMERKGEAWRF